MCTLYYVYIIIIYTLYNNFKYLYFTIANIIYIEGDRRCIISIRIHYTFIIPPPPKNTGQIYLSILYI